MSLYVPQLKSYANTAFGPDFYIPPEWTSQTITIYRPEDIDDAAGARTVGPVSLWPILFKNVPCAMILESAEEANPEDEKHQVLEQIARYVFLTNVPITVGQNAVRDSDLIGIGPIMAPNRLLVVKTWEQWPETLPTFFKVTGQEIRP